jgi:hypothetical protein
MSLHLPGITVITNLRPFSIHYKPAIKNFFMNEWNSLFAATAGASATLTGLLLHRFCRRFFIYKSSNSCLVFFGRN